MKERFINIRITMPGDPKEPMPFEVVGHTLKQIISEHTNGMERMLFCGDAGIMFHFTNSFELP